MKFIAVTSIALLFAQQALATPIAGCLQNHTITLTDSCTSVAAQFQITEAEFYAMNPGLHHSVQHDCDNLDNGKPFCVCTKAPCPVADVTGSAASAAVSGAASSAPLASNASFANATASAAVSSVASVASSAVTSASASASASVVPTANGTASSSIAASSQTAATKSSAAITTALGAVTIGLVMTATSMLL